MCQFTQLEKAEPQKIFAEKECKILRALLANITATDENRNEINTFFTLLPTNTTAKIKKIFFSVFIIQFSMTSVKSVINLSQFCIYLKSDLLEIFKFRKWKILNFFRDLWPNNWSRNFNRFFHLLFWNLFSMKNFRPVSGMIVMDCRYRNKCGAVRYSQYILMNFKH